MLAILSPVDENGSVSRAVPTSLAAAGPLSLAPEGTAAATTTALALASASAPGGARSEQAAALAATPMTQAVRMVPTDLGTTALTRNGSSTLSLEGRGNDEACSAMIRIPAVAFRLVRNL